MGRTHLDAYAAMPSVRVVAVADRDEARRTGKAAADGNIDGQAAGGFDLADPAVQKFAHGEELIASPEVDAVDICAPTPAHLPLARTALAAGKHVFVEKPPARTHADAVELARLADESDRVTMVGLCMRFWPGWTHLKKWQSSGEFGRLVSASFARQSSHPGGRFYEDADASGAALLDLHLHDTDFINHLLGTPTAVSSVGASRITAGVDHVATLYHYGAGPAVIAEGGWAMQNGFPFTMRYTANFEQATAIFDLAAADPLRLIRDGQTTPIKLDGMGYAAELTEWAAAIAENRPPRTATASDAAEAVRVIEAEEQSIRTGQRVTL